MSARERKPVLRKLLLRLVVSAVLVALLVKFVKWEPLRSAFSQLSLLFFALIVVALLACHVIGVFKWRLVIATAGAKLGPRDAFECYATGLFSNVFLPSIVGGDVLRALLAGRRSGRAEAAILGSAADRLIDVAALGLLALVSTFFVGLKSTGAARTLITLAVAFVVIGAIACLPLLLRTPLQRWPVRVRRRLARVLVALRRQRRRPGVALLSLAGACAMQSSLVLLNVWIGHRIGIDASLSAWFFAWSLAKVAALLPVSFNGIGVRDAAFAAFFVPFMRNAGLGLGELQGKAVAASFIWQGVLIAGSLVAGGVAWLLRRAPRSEDPGAATPPRARARAPAPQHV